MVRSKSELYDQRQASRLFVDDERLVEIPNHYVQFMKKDEYTRDLAELFSIAKKYEKDINEKTELLKVPPPTEPLRGADTTAKTMRKQVLVVLDNSEQYLIKVRKAIADLEQEKATWDKTLSIPKCMTAQLPQEASRPEGSRENPVTLPPQTTSLVQPEYADQEIKAGSAIMAKGGPQENEEPSRINLSTSQQPKETFTNKTMGTALSDSHDQRSENITERQPYHPSHLKNPATCLLYTSPSPRD